MTITHTVTAGFMPRDMHQRRYRYWPSPRQYPSPQFGGTLAGFPAEKQRKWFVENRESILNSPKKMTKKFDGSLKNVS